MYEIQLGLKRGYFGAAETKWVLREVNWGLGELTRLFRKVTSVLGEVTFVLGKVIYGHGMGMAFFRLKCLKGFWRILEAKLGTQGCYLEAQGDHFGP